MVKIVSLLSYRGGTGKSNLSANLAWLAARGGASVAVLDTDLQSPGVHIVLQADMSRAVFTLSDFVAKRCQLEEVAIDLTAELEIGTGGGKLFLLPSSMSVEAITRVIANGYDAGHLNQALAGLVEALALDLLILDCHPGLNRETLLTAAVSDVLLVLVRPDAQDFQGTAVITEVASKLQVPSILLVASKVIDGVDPVAFAARLEAAFGFPVAASIPLLPGIARLGSDGIFARLHPDHPVVTILQQLTNRLLAAPGHGESADVDEVQEVP
jgi:MinD-like ATPase involved in chromosome partitioning or flagellar assembly